MLQIHAQGFTKLAKIMWYVKYSMHLGIPYIIFPCLWNPIWGFACLREISYQDPYEVSYGISYEIHDSIWNSIWNAMFHWMKSISYVDSRYGTSYNMNLLISPAWARLIFFIWQALLTHGTMSFPPWQARGNVGFPLVLPGEMGNYQNPVLVDVRPYRLMGIRTPGHWNLKGFQWFLWILRPVVTQVSPTLLCP